MTETRSSIERSGGRLEKAMARRAETSVVYAAGAVPGIVLVTFPAAATIFSERAHYDLSKTRSVRETGRLTLAR